MGFGIAFVSVLEHAMYDLKAESSTTKMIARTSLLGLRFMTSTPALWGVHRLGLSERRAAAERDQRTMLPTSYPQRLTARTRQLTNALNVLVFMHPCTRRQATLLLGWLVKNRCMTIMRVYAL